MLACMNERVQFSSAGLKLAGLLQKSKGQMRLTPEMKLISTGPATLDAAKALKYQSVVDYLVEKGARSGTENRD